MEQEPALLEKGLIWLLILSNLHNREAARVPGVPEGPEYTSKATVDPFRPIYRSPEECKGIAWILRPLETALLL